MAGGAGSGPGALSYGWVFPDPDLNFVNATGLVAGQTTLRDELALLWSATEINASMLRDIVGRVWNGTTFA